LIFKRNQSEKERKLDTVRLKNKLYVFKTKLQQKRNKNTTKQQQNQNFGQTKS